MTALLEYSMDYDGPIFEQKHTPKPIHLKYLAVYKKH